jgi:hypothetical protein
MSSPGWGERLFGPPAAPQERRRPGRRTPQSPGLAFPSKCIPSADRGHMRARHAWSANPVPLLGVQRAPVVSPAPSIEGLHSVRVAAVLLPEKVNRSFGRPPRSTNFLHNLPVNDDPEWRLERRLSHSSCFRAPAFPEDNLCACRAPAVNRGGGVASIPRHHFQGLW